MTVLWGVNASATVTAIDATVSVRANILAVHAAQELALKSEPGFRLDNAAGISVDEVDVLLARRVQRSTKCHLGLVFVQECLPTIWGHLEP